MAHPETASADGRVAALPPAAPAPARHGRRWLFIIGGVAALAAAAFFLTPVVATSLNTVSTDDAYVNGHVTFAAPRVAGQVTRVFVDDNYRVKAGEPLVQLDEEPYRVQVSVKQAMVAAAEADVVAARASATATEASARGNRWQVVNTIEQVKNQIANLRATVATYRSALATRDRARADYDRGERLRRTGALSAEELDTRRQDVRVGEAHADEALEGVARVRVALGLESRPPGGPAKPETEADLEKLAEVPPELPQNFSAVRTALGKMVQNMAELGLKLAGTNDTPDQVLENFKKLNDRGDIDQILADLVNRAPGVKQAEARLKQARADLDQAELNLRYTKVVAEIDGVVTRRNVNPGNNVQAGQQLMAVRSLREIWIDCNFKETQLATLSIGQRVEVYADLYGSRKKFNGRITGFTYGTGSTLALLPAQNATGNFVKVVQRLPVRVEFEDYDPDRDTLFAGLSVTPYVYFKEPAQGPNAGKKLQEALRNEAPAKGPPPATTPPPPAPTTPGSAKGAGK